MNPENKLLALIASGLQKHSQVSTASQLGDRTQYIGMSDIANMQECPRLTVLRKLNPIEQEVNTENFSNILKRQLTLQRGHWLEEGIANALYANNFKVIPQLEIAVQVQNVPVKVHLDFVIVGENSIRILELKSTENIPQKARTTHEIQVPI